MYTCAYIYTYYQPMAYHFMLNTTMVLRNKL